MMFSRTWIVFAILSCIALAALGWTGKTVLELEHAQEKAQRDAVLEESIRLALWRIDTQLQPMVYDENSRPYFFYRPYYSANRPMTCMQDPPTLADVMVPSPLFKGEIENILLHFQIDPKNHLSSPRLSESDSPPISKGNAPNKQRSGSAQTTNTQNSMLNRFACSAGVTDQEKAVLVERFNRLRNLLDGEKIRKRLSRTSSRQGIALAGPPAITPQNDVDNVQTLQAPNEPIANSPVQQAMPQVAQQGQSLELSQAARNMVDYQKRANFATRGGKYPQTANNDDVQSEQNASRQTPETNGRSALPQTTGRTAASNVGNSSNAQIWANRILADEVLEELLEPMWIDDELMLIRRVTIGKDEYLQGAWIDWPKLKSQLQLEISDLLPNADFSAISSDQSLAQSQRRSAVLPIAVQPGQIDIGGKPMFTPIRWSLLLASIGLLFTLLAAGVLLHGIVSLSDRRAAFVSAVTHELRTPLTTFRMYSEMLKDGMVRADDQRQKYYQTLHTEADRLAQLVDNVLTYAKVERRKAGAKREVVSITAILDRVLPRLIDRTGQAGFALDVSVVDEIGRPTDGSKLLLNTDVGVIEQILFNLVDNACKYAGSASNKTIHLEIGATDHAHSKATRRAVDWLSLGLTRWFRSKAIYLRVRDHGPGISARDRRRLFQPFSKSSEEAASQAIPGVGLGLSLCYKLARRLGGTLCLDSTSKTSPASNSRQQLGLTSSGQHSTDSEAGSIQLPECVDRTNGSGAAFTLILPPHR